MRKTLRPRLHVRAALTGAALLAVIALGACSSDSTDTPVPPTPLPTSPAATATSDTDATATAPAATATSSAASPTAVVTATATSDPLVILSLLVTGEIDPNTYPSLEPGESSLLDRSFEGAPPQVSHRASNMEISPVRNACVECHETGKTFSGSVAVQIPISHYTDLTTGTITGELYPGRYVCVSCHVPQVVDNPPYLSD